MKTFIITAGDIVSEYTVETVDCALNAYARDAGYHDYFELTSQWGTARSVHVLDTDAIVKALPVAVFDDAYGGGVAVIEGKSYSWWLAVCEQYDIDYCDYLESVPVPARVESRPSQHTQG